MAKYSKFNIVYLLQKWMDSVAGQTFMNYAYSWGAAVVILGTLFKLTHLPGANTMLFIGMGTEVFVFFISAFDRPFDKTQDGRELATDSQLAAEAQAELLAGQGEAGSPVNSPLSGGVIVTGNIPVGGGIPQQEQPQASVNTASSNGGTVIIGAGMMSNSSQNAAAVLNPRGETAEENDEAVAQDNAQTIAFAQPSAGNNAVTGAPAPAVMPETAQAMEEATTTYVDRLNELNELLLKVGAQTERITTDSEEMENLNRTLTGIARVYEMQLKSASQQITTQDEINEQTKKLAQQIQELNDIYARMIEAMNARR